jgi:hypothetical protein
MLFERPPARFSHNQPQLQENLAAFVECSTARLAG